MNTSGETSVRTPVANDPTILTSLCIKLKIKTHKRNRSLINDLIKMTIIIIVKDDQRRQPNPISIAAKSLPLPNPIHKQGSAGNLRPIRPWYIDVILAFELKTLLTSTTFRSTILSIKDALLLTPGPQRYSQPWNSEAEDKSAASQVAVDEYQRLASTMFSSTLACSANSETISFRYKRHIRP